MLQRLAAQVEGRMLVQLVLCFTLQHSGGILGAHGKPNLHPLLTLALHELHALPKKSWIDPTMTALLSAFT